MTEQNLIKLDRRINQLINGSSQQRQKRQSSIVNSVRHNGNADFKNDYNIPIGGNSSIGSKQSRRSEVSKAQS